MVPLVITISLMLLPIAFLSYVMIYPEVLVVVLHKIFLLFPTYLEYAMRRVQDKLWNDLGFTAPEPFLLSEVMAQR